ncbi:bacteriocin 51 precursor BacA [Pediococcus ethanolidurans]
MPFSPKVVHASSKRYYHNHPGYTCYKMNYHVNYKTCKKLKSNYKKLKTPAAIASLIPIGGVTGWIVSNTFGSSVAALKVFVKAVNKKKGVQLRYIAHFSNYSTATYSSNFHYTIK